MTEKSMFFYNATEIESRPSYNPTQEISPENFHALIGMYRFDDDVICQVRTSSGICHQKHKSGWLGVTHEGDEAYIGGHCAKKYFRADSRFKLEKNRVKSEIERNTALNKIEEYLSNKSILKENLSNLRSQLIDVRKELDLFYKTFPGGVLRFIDGAQRTGNWSIMVDVLTPYSNNQIKNNKK
ncbi:TPA: hypothetical protein ACS777_000173 [Providencia alcalifaciens]